MMQMKTNLSTKAMIDVLPLMFYMKGKITFGGR
jgi:hypothetical protein